MQTVIYPISGFFILDIVVFICRSLCLYLTVNVSSRFWSIRNIVISVLTYLSTNPIITVILRSFLIDFSYTKLLWILDQWPWPASYEVFHSGGNMQYFWPCVTLPLNTLEQFSLSSGSFLICLCQSVLCWVVCKSLLCAFSSTFLWTQAALPSPKFQLYLISGKRVYFIWDYPPWAVAWKFFLDNKLGQL